MSLTVSPSSITACMSLTVSPSFITACMSLTVSPSFTVVRQDDVTDWIPDLEKIINMQNADPSLVSAFNGLGDDGEDVPDDAAVIGFIATQVKNGTAFRLRFRCLSSLRRGLSLRNPAAAGVASMARRQRSAGQRQRPEQARLGEPHQVLAGRPWRRAGAGAWRRRWRGRAPDGGGKTSSKGRLSCSETVPFFSEKLPFGAVL